MSVKANAETLRTIPIFADCDPVHLQVIAFSAARQAFAPGASILEQGVAGDSSFLILDGGVSLYQSDGSVRTLLGQAVPGAFIGEVAMISERPYSISVVANTPVEAVRIDRKLFMRVAEEYPEFGARVFRALARRLDSSLSDLADAKTLFDRARSFSNL